MLGNRDDFLRIVPQSSLFLCFFSAFFSKIEALKSKISEIFFNQTLENTCQNVLPKFFFDPLMFSL